MVNDPEESPDPAELKKWMGQSRGALLFQLRNLIEGDAVAMRRVGIFLSEAGVSLEKANMFALTLALKIAKMEMRVPKILPAVLN